MGIDPASGEMQAPGDSNERARMVNAALLPLFAVVLLWSIHLLDAVYGWELARWGNTPRSAAGLPGILFQPFLHGDLEHLLNNALSLLVLGWCLVYFYPRVAGRVALGTWLLSGLGVWLTARPDRHIGASGVVYGLAFFLFVSGVLRRQRALMAISLLVVFLYGGLVWGLLPTLPRISWESHFWGGLIGAFMAWWYRAVEPAHVFAQPAFDEMDDDADPADLGTITSGPLDPNDEAGGSQPVDPTTLQPYYDPSRTSSTGSTGDPRS